MRLNTGKKYLPWPLGYLELAVSVSWAYRDRTCIKNGDYLLVQCRWGDCDGAVVKVLCYKSEGRWFDLSWCQWIFHWHKILPIALWPWCRLSLQQKWVPGVFPGGKDGRCVRLTTLPPSYAVVTKSGSLNFLEPSGPLQACNGTALPFAVQMEYE